MNFEDIFNNDFDIIDTCDDFDNGCDNVPCDTTRFSNDILSPPISMPTSSKCLESALLPAYNDLELRESNFLRRMQKSPKKEDDCLSSCDFTIIPITVKHTNESKHSVSNVTVKLGTLPSCDQNFTKRANNRRAMKSQMQQRQQNQRNDHFINTEQIEDDYFKPLVW